MSGNAKRGDNKFAMSVNDLQALLALLQKQGYRILGPTVANGAIVIDDISAVSDLPKGMSDDQDPGSYRLTRSGSDDIFGYVLGPQSWKKYLYPPRKRLWTANREKSGFQLEHEVENNEKMAFIGVRPCELEAIKILDKILMNGPYRDPGYASRRKNTLIVAVNCSRAGGTCFCASMGTGPVANSGFDLALTEVSDSHSDYFVVESGSDTGSSLLKSLGLAAATSAQTAAAKTVSENAVRRMGRYLDIDGLKEILNRNHDNPRWDEAGARCLNCGNCTMVCPTCFCGTVEDFTDLSGKQAERYQRWDSCFTMNFSYIHGGSIRPSAKARYRQYVTHKLAHWIDQFGMMGCVGCGRCITWCPAAIDITEEARAIRDSERTKQTTT